MVSDVNLFYKEVSDSTWQMMYGKREKNIECMITNKSNRMQIEYDLNEDVKACANLPLIDNSVIGITVGAKLDKSDFTEFDKITLQIFLQLLDNAYQSFLTRQKEKNLIFELNQRVLQLNNLIDTGIDLSKFENRNLLFELGTGEQGTVGDCWDRYMVRAREIEQSCRLVRQALETLPEGPYQALELKKIVKAPAGAVYSRTESSKGELGHYIISDGGQTAFRNKVRSPSFCNLQVVTEVGKGQMISDLVALVGSLDIVLGEIDR